MGDCGVAEYNSRIHEIILNEKETSQLPQSENIFFFNLTDFNLVIYENLDWMTNLEPGNTSYQKNPCIKIRP